MNIVRACGREHNMFPTHYRQYPNQRIIKTQKEPSNKENLYSVMNISALENAIKVLSHKGLKLWLYFNKNQNNYMFGLSKVETINKWSLNSDSTYHNAFNELVDKGFLVEVDRDDFIFYELPQKYKKDSS